MNLSAPSLKISWLLESNPEGEYADSSDGDLDRQPLAIPEDMGEGHFALLRLPYGTAYFRSVQRFKPQASGRLITLGPFQFEYGSPTFIVQTMHGGRLCQRELLPELTHAYEEGRDLFCHLEKRHTIPMIDGSSDSEMVSLGLRISSLEALLGGNETETLLRILGIGAVPGFAVRAMPRSLAAILRAPFSSSLIGPARKLFAQAKALQYLSSLYDHLYENGSQASSAVKRKAEIKALHRYLLDLEGRLPTLEALARQFGQPARRLNANFLAEYGEPIISFVNARRLDQAHEALQHSELPMKVLAGRLGYSHVNNFIIAFKRRFGYSPGSLRKQGRRGAQG